MNQELEFQEPPRQLELPLALLHGKPVTELPTDLFIPPQALKVFLEAFEGPLDLLLYLIKKQNLDILEIPIADITSQYMEYVELMQKVELDLAGEYLVMAAMLTEIKSRLLLPRPVNEEGEEVDPRAELVRRLQEYERFKRAAEDLDTLLRVGRDNFMTQIEVNSDLLPPRPQAEIQLKDLLMALHEVLARVDKFAHHHIEREQLSIRERMSLFLQRLHNEQFTEFTELLVLSEGRRGVVVSFMAILELVKQSLIELVQSQPLAPIHVRLRSGTAE